MQKKSDFLGGCCYKVLAVMPSLVFLSSDHHVLVLVLIRTGSMSLGGLDFVIGFISYLWKAPSILPHPVTCGSSLLSFHTRGEGWEANLALTHCSASPAAASLGFSIIWAFPALE